MIRALVALSARVHGCEPGCRLQGQEEREEVAEGHLWRLVELPQDLVGAVRVHVMVTVSLDSEQKRARRRIPAVTLRDWLVNAPSILSPGQAIVLDVVN